ncbi:hypothetical protein [Pseudonocardia spinosispora]|uniref:hypothetical protein n=1 Tax=Pseudonocardia spinosispora TaxID=103441 RepID=UPI0004267D9C|nr:hypothetical protein [Pseudonocardia spinosispora]
MNAQRRTSIRRGNKATAPDPTPTASDEHPTQVFSAYRDDPEDTPDPETRGADAEVVDEWEMALRGDEPSAQAPAVRDRATKALRRGIARQKQRSTAPEAEQVAQAEPEAAAAPEVSSSDERPTQVFSAIRDDTPAPEAKTATQAAEVTEEKRVPSPGPRAAAVTDTEQATPKPDTAPSATSSGATKQTEKPAEKKPESASPLAAQLFGDYPGRDERVETTVMPRITDDGWPADGDWDSPGARAEEPARAVATATEEADEVAETDDTVEDAAPEQRDELEDTAQHNVVLDFDDEDDDEVDEHAAFAGHNGAAPEAPAEDDDHAEQDSVVGHWDPKQWATARTEAAEQEEQAEDVAEPEADRPEAAEVQHEEREERDEETTSAPAEAAEERTQLIPAFRDDESEDDATEATAEEQTGEQAAIRADDDEAPGERTELIPAYPMGRFGDETAAERTEFIPTYTPDGAAIITEPGGKPQPVASALGPVRDSKTKSPRDAAKRPVALVAVLLLVGLLGGGAAYLMQGKAAVAARTTPSSNLALIDMAATAQVKGEITSAVQTIYSYDSKSLDQSEPKALALITGDYANEFKQTYAAVRKLGQKMHVSLASTVAEAGVESLTERRATLLMMVNQIGRQGDNGQPLKAQVRLSVTVQKIGGQWKVSGVTSR